MERRKGNRNSSCSPPPPSVDFQIGNCKVEFQGTKFNCNSSSNNNTLEISVSNAAKIEIHVKEEVGALIGNYSFLLVNPKDIDSRSKSLLQKRRKTGDTEKGKEKQSASETEDEPEEEEATKPKQDLKKSSSLKKHSAAGKTKSKGTTKKKFPASSKSASKEKISKETTSKEKVSKEKSGKNVAKGKEKTKKGKSGPTEDELQKAICEILKEVDFNTTTFTDILKKLVGHFNMDLTPRKAAIKLMIQEELAKLADEDDEDD